MERTTDDDARMLVEYNIAQYQYLMREADKAYDNGDDVMYRHYQSKAMCAAHRVDDLRGLTDEGVR